jgi:hypothetical protein
VKAAISRRALLGSTGAALVLPVFGAVAAEPVDPEFAQPILAQARQVIATFAKLGEPLDAVAVENIETLAASGDFMAAVTAAAELFAKHILLSVLVSPEARVSVLQGGASPRLVQSGWRIFLVQIENGAMVPGRLNLTSPQAKPVNSRYPAGHQHADPNDVLDATAVPPGVMAERWLDITVHDEPPLPAALQPVPIEYRVIALYARDAGRRSAQLFPDIGAGTGDIGSRGYATVAFDIVPARDVKLQIRDHDGKPVTASLLVRDAQGRVFPAQTKRVLPDLYFQQKVYRADGQTLTLTPGEYDVEVARGPEYLVKRSKQPVFADRASAWAFKLERWIDPRIQGYYSGDHHIHASGCSHYSVPEEGVPPSVMAPQVQGEALSIGAVLTWGPGFYTQKLNFSGRDDAVSTADHLVHYDLEVSGFPSSHGGHLVLLGMKAMDYPGTMKIEQWPSHNVPVLEWARSQGAITGYAHSGSGLWAGTTDLPNYRMPAFDGIGANDFIVTVTRGLIDFISSVNTTPAAELNIWYHTLGAGYRARISGETDWPCFYDESMGMGRSYVKLDGPLSYESWCSGLKAGRNYVSEGRAHLMNMRVSAGAQRTELGCADLKLAAPAPIRIEVLVAARLEVEPTAATEKIRALGPLDKPYWHLERARLGDTRQVMVELIVNGRPVETRLILADGEQREIVFDYTPTNSCWIALRIMHGAHSNPVWVTIADKPVRVARSIEWCRKAVDQCWNQKKLRIRSAELAGAAAHYDEARAAYDARAKDALA